ncbi:hypothetical protein U9M48_018104 [Paspalum notatum var. saurae]|uniref:RING-type E3 ubiquitin transferase n=1 Tax=Paspalum notatum var. saurae TaxID=547442 RepID=A0AAQ3WPS8_PASNO
MKYDIPLLDYDTRFSLWQVKIDDALDKFGRYKYFGGDGILKVSKGSLIIMKAELKSANLYRLRGTTITGDAAVISNSLSNSDATNLWHMCLGHMSELGLQVLSKRGLLDGHSVSKLKFCEHCVFDKHKRVKFNTSTHTSKGILDYVHSDLWGPSRKPSHGGSRYMLTIIDDYFRKKSSVQVEHFIDVDNTPENDNDAVQDAHIPDNSPIVDDSSSVEHFSPIVQPPQHSIAVDKAVRARKTVRRLIEECNIAYVLSVAEGIEGAGASVAVNKECGIRMSFWFTGVWTTRDRSAVAGVIWNSTQAAAGNDVAGRVVSASSIDVGIHMSNFSDVKYSYNDTMVEEAKKHYQDIVKQQKKVKGSSFLAPNYTDHDFELRFCEDRGFGFFGDGHAYPVSIGSTVVYGDRLAADNSFVRGAVFELKHELVNVSYDIVEFVPRISYSAALEARQMRAEGVFDSKTGILCLIACREYNDSTTDCRIMITVQFASLDGKAQLEGHGRGAIRSLRNKTANDPLFFDKTDNGLYGMYAQQVSESISRMDLESILLLISTTLSCVFTALQILHAKRKPEAAAATSVTMLVVLALGYVAPLLVRSEALFVSRRRQYVPFKGYVPYELSQAVMRAPTLIALLLQLRLLQLTLSARKKTTTDVAESSSAASAAAESERRALWLCVPLYLIGGALTVIVHAVNVRRAARGQGSALTRRVGPRPATLWADLMSSAGLALDAFLLPQVAMNALSPVPGARVVRALSPWFYIGGTVVRAIPHVYDAIRAQGYVPSLKPSYVYASPRYDRFGVAWDVGVPCGAALLAMLLFLQQRVGLPARRRLGKYEMVSPL